MKWSMRLETYATIGAQVETQPTLEDWALIERLKLQATHKNLSEQVTHRPATAMREGLV
jgi:hypothetical protein